jgi:ribose-phosphate pyrophosphokinase
MKIIAGSSNLPLAQNIARSLKLPLIDIDISYFANGEKRIWIKEPVKGENVIIVQSFSHPADEHIIEFLLIADALERLGARHVNAVIPWMGYSLQDKAFRVGEPIAAKMVANLVSNAYIKRAFLLDLHNSSTPGFFSIPTQHLSALNLYVEYAKQNFDLSNFVVASPDFGGLKRSRVFSEKIGVPLVNIDKHRDLGTGEIQAMGLHGDVEGKSVLLFDDAINSGATIVKSAKTLKENGAKEVHFCATHGLFADNGVERIQNSMVDSVIITNSIHHEQVPSKIKVIDVSGLFADELNGWM